MPLAESVSHVGLGCNQWNNGAVASGQCLQIAAPYQLIPPPNYTTNWRQIYQGSRLNAALNGHCVPAKFVNLRHLLIAVNFDYLMKIRTKSMKDYSRVLAERISTLPHFASTSTYVAMQAVKENGYLDIT